MATMGPETQAQTQTPRGPRADRPAPSAPHLSSHITPSQPPRSSKRYPGLRMASSPAGLGASSNPPSSTSLRHVHPTLTPKRSQSSQRHASMSSITSDRAATPVSKSSVKDSQSSAQLATQSTLLQEKLQQERRSEIQRSLTRLAGEMGSSNEPRAVLATPTRCATADGRRQEPTAQEPGTGRSKGLTLLEMDQTMSTLHKQNFDLKLELFHRRERQTVLEEKIEALEAGLATAEQTNTMMIQDMERRDKAVEEAVTMIVSLEARIELLLREREMTRQVEANQVLLSQLNLNHSPSATLVNQGVTPRQQDDTTHHVKHTLDRMPSFLSERTENTENLRNVYLEPKSSYLSLSKADSRADNHGFVSPSMSVLSESSFVSVYGQKSLNDTSSPPNMHTIQNRLASSGQRSVSLPSRDYPTSRPQTAGKQGIPQSTPLPEEVERSTTVRPTRPQVFPKVRKDIERPARKVIIDEASPNHQRLPPTPDTVTSSMIHRQQMSDDLLHGESSVNDMRQSVVTRLTLDQTEEVEPGHWRFKSPEVAQPPSITAFTGRKEGSVAAYYENRLPAMRRPRSADETTISRHKLDWDSCSDADDLCSEASSVDPWMKVGLQPSRGGVTKTQTKTFSAQYRPGREPPDLFSFPSDAKGWNSNDMFGNLGESGYHGIDSPFAPALDALGASLPAPETGLYGSGLAGASSPRAHGAPVAAPPAPYRRSSLKAHTSAPGTPTTTRGPGPQAQVKPNESDHSRKRSMAGHQPNTPSSNGWPMSNHRSKSPAAPPTRAQDASAPKRHYPPHASQPQAAPRPRSRGLSSLFRRSLGSTTPQPSASVPPSATQSPFPPPADKEPSPMMVGFPAWERRHEISADGGVASSATPPPILRNRGGADGQGGGKGRPATAGKSGLGSGLGNVMGGHQGGGGGAPLTGLGDEMELGVAVQDGKGHGRRWLNFGRAANGKGIGA